jgi:uracil-DNA glycosylase family 4
VLADAMPPAYRFAVPRSSPHIRSPLPHLEPSHDCPLCPRLVVLREALRVEYPEWWNAPVPAMGDPDAWLGLVGLAPGKHGANRTGRPFTGDYAGDLLFETLAKFGFLSGTYRSDPADGVQLVGAVILNSVKCLPPQNKPLPEEVRNCSRFFEAQWAAIPSLRIMVALGQIAHQATIRAVGGRQVDYRFGHGAVHGLPDGRVLIDSYHCSRYNQNTGRLTAPMFESVFAKAHELRAANN